MSNFLQNISDKIIFENDSHYVWPRITKDVESVVLKQLYREISIYNRSGVFEEFENKFSTYHGRQFALLSNSGTNALFSMFEGINLGRDDEIICPTYTFFATISSVVYTGAHPVFCDCDESGNITATKIQEKITTKTKAVIVTHMWGMPCDMDKIVSLCKKHNLYLLEDCSHAHGAEYNDSKVGTFGDAAAWSLQGQKTVTGGEGGIMLTDNKEIHYRATLQGHYNKRCMQEIPKSENLSKFSLTGFGLKFRAHPLAIAIANEQFSHLDEWILQRQKYVDMFVSAFGNYRFLKMPAYKNKKPSWYAFIMQFDENYSNGVSLDDFYNSLHKIGLKEVDRPGSTRPIHNLPLFNYLDEAMPRLYEKQDKKPMYCSFPQAEKFYRNAIKLPVWAFADEQKIVETYIKGIKCICDIIVEKPELFKEREC